MNKTIVETKTNYKVIDDIDLAPNISREGVVVETKTNYKIFFMILYVGSSTLIILYL